MSNFALFICGIVVTLIAGLGVSIYIISLGYESKEKKTVEVDIDPGATDLAIN